MALDIEKVETLVLEAEEKFEKTSEMYKSDLTQVRAGRANPHFRQSRKTPKFCFMVDSHNVLRIKKGCISD